MMRYKFECPEEHIVSKFHKSRNYIKAFMQAVEEFDCTSCAEGFCEGPRCVVEEIAPEGV